jgi:hypothetical protein
MRPADREDPVAPSFVTRRWLEGLTPKALALIAVLTLLHALRRTTDSVLDAPWTRWLHDVGQTFATGSIVLLLIMLAVVTTYNRATRWRYWAVAAAVVVASVCGTLILMAIESQGTFTFEDTPAVWMFVGSWPRYALLGFLLAAVFVYFRTAEEGEAATRRAELDRANFARQMDEARLQVLQAQIEPHFLFNTLATVRRLYQSDAVSGESMLENLMRYLTVALPQMRSADSTLGREIALVEAYLEIQKIRMGRRLTYAMDVPARLRDVHLPPMMLLTLAENAIKHGIGPLLDGGFIHLSARGDSGQLRVELADSGQGFAKSSGGGTGLANIRARLAAIYGPAAQLSLALNHPQGVTAAITLPYAAWAPSVTPA